MHPPEKNNLPDCIRLIAVAEKVDRPRDRKKIVPPIETIIQLIVQGVKGFIAASSFDLPTYGLWAHRASTAPRCFQVKSSCRVSIPCLQITRVSTCLPVLSL